MKRVCDCHGRTHVAGRYCADQTERLAALVEKARRRAERRYGQVDSVRRQLLLIEANWLRDRLDAMWMVWRDPVVLNWLVGLADHVRWWHGIEPLVSRVLTDRPSADELAEAVDLARDRSQEWT